MHRLFRYLTGNENVSAGISGPIDIALSCPGAPYQLLHCPLTNEQRLSVKRSRQLVGQLLNGYRSGQPAGIQGQLSVTGNEGRWICNAHQMP
jgi:hypothetical protein